LIYGGTRQHRFPFRKSLMLPLELLEEIAQHLDLHSYHQFRISFRSQLSSIAKLRYAVYRRYAVPTSGMEIASKPTRWMLQELIQKKDLEFCRIAAQYDRGFDWLKEMDYFYIADDTELFLYFLRSCSDFNWIHDGFLEYCCEKGYIVAVEALLHYPVNPAVGLVAALEELNLPLLKILIQDSRITSLDDLFCGAVEMNFPELVELLLSDPRCNPTDLDYGITIACMMGYTRIVSLLLEDTRIAPDVENQLCIRSASERGHHDVVSILLQDSRVDPSARNNECIRMASKFGHYGVVELLMDDSRVDPSANENEAIKQALLRGHSSIVTLLCQDKRVQIPTEDSIPLYNVM
jgi:hypothetical protein